MATVTITNTSVVPSGIAPQSSGIAGEAIAAGNFVYLKASDSRWYKADCTTLEKSGNGVAQNIRMALNDAVAAGQPIALAEPGATITVGSVVTKGIWYVLSATAAKMANHGDLTTGQYSVSLGYAPSSTTFYFDPKPTGVTV